MDRAAWVSVPAASFTPYENARRLGRAVPKGREPIDSITESYVQFSFSGRRVAGGAGRGSQHGRNCGPCYGAHG